MTVAEPYRPGLDPAHVLAICAQATGGRRGLAVRGTDGIIICLLPSRRTAHQASLALARVGYEVTTMSSGRGRDLIVAGWSTPGLDTRVATMRTILSQLTDPAVTARAVIERFRHLPAESQTPQTTWELLNKARAGLRDWVAARSGIHAPRACAIGLADTGIASRLRAAEMLERAINDHIERQLRVAGYALVLFRHLHHQVDGDRAEATAIRWASITFHLSGPTALEPSRLIQCEFPHAATEPGMPANVVALDPARRGAQRFPAPRLHR